MCWFGRLWLRVPHLRGQFHFLYFSIDCGWRDERVQAAAYGSLFGLHSVAYFLYLFFFFLHGHVQPLRAYVLKCVNLRILRVLSMLPHCTLRKRHESFLFFPVFFLCLPAFLVRVYCSAATFLFVFFFPDSAATSSVVSSWGS